MVPRLLYRLLLQRLGRAAGARPAESGTIGRPTNGAASPLVHPKAAKVLMLVAVALAVTVLVVVLPVALEDDGSALADLSLNIPTVGTKPLVVYLRGAGLDPPLPDTGSAPPYRIRSADGRFLPEFQIVPRASTMEMINTDSIAHNTHVFNRGETVFNVALPLQDVTVRKMLTGDGIFEVRCDMHPWMRARVFVSPSRHYAVVEEPTTVRFTGIAPGEYVLHDWEPGRAEHIRLVHLAAGETRHLRLRSHAPGEPQLSGSATWDRRGAPPPSDPSPRTR